MTPPTPPKKITRFAPGEKHLEFTACRQADIDFIQSFGYKIDLGHEVGSGWIAMETDIGWHHDDMGKTFVYCASGKGTLYVTSDSTAIKSNWVENDTVIPDGLRPWKKRLQAGERVCFDSDKFHMFLVDESPCILLVASVK
jgi:hypothetical protein